MLIKTKKYLGLECMRGLGGNQNKELLWACMYQQFGCKSKERSTHWLACIRGLGAKLNKEILRVWVHQRLSENQNKEV